MQNIDLVTRGGGDVEADLCGRGRACGTVLSPKNWAIEWENMGF